jgi:hypothetical protein
MSSIKNIYLFRDINFTTHSPANNNNLKDELMKMNTSDHSILFQC